MKIFNLKLRKTQSACTLNQVNTAKNKHSPLTYILAQSFHLHFFSPSLIFTLSGQIVVYIKTKK